MAMTVAISRIQAPITRQGWVAQDRPSRYRKEVIMAPGLVVGGRPHSGRDHSSRT